MAFLESLFKKKDGRVNNGANLTPEITRKAVEESAEVRRVKAETKKMMELAKFYTAKQKVEAIVNPVNDDDDMTKFMKMVALAMGNAENPKLSTFDTPPSQPNPDPETPFSQKQTTLNEEVEEVPDNWQKFYNVVLEMPEDKFSKMINMLLRFS